MAVVTYGAAYATTCGIEAASLARLKICTISNETLTATQPVITASDDGGADLIKTPGVLGKNRSN